MKRREEREKEKNAVNSVTAHASRSDQFQEFYGNFVGWPPFFAFTNELPKITKETIFVLIYHRTQISTFLLLFQMTPILMPFDAIY